jgi:hypothetical protein
MSDRWLNRLWPLALLALFVGGGTLAVGMTRQMPDNGLQVVMFTHQDAAVWADLGSILWAAGLRVTAAWNVVTETESSLKAGMVFNEETDASHVGRNGREAHNLCAMHFRRSNRQHCDPKLARGCGIP